MFNIGPLEFMLIFLVALIVFGPQKLPEVARFLGKAAREVQKLSAGAYGMWHEITREQPAAPVDKRNNDSSYSGQGVPSAEKESNQEAEAETIKEKGEIL